MGAPHPEQKRILCMNKVDLVEKKKDLLEVAEQFKDLPGFDK
jgi:GTP-binding protein Era